MEFAPTGLYDKGNELRVFQLHETAKIIKEVLQAMHHY
jgi:hypothetical protein